MWSRSSPCGLGAAHVVGAAHVISGPHSCIPTPTKGVQFIYPVFPAFAVHQVRASRTAGPWPQMRERGEDGCRR